MYARVEMCCPTRSSCKSHAHLFAHKLCPFDQVSRKNPRGRAASTAEAGQIEGRPAERIVLGHPVGLTNLFGVELWERLSFYGMLTILGYYLYYSVTDGGLEMPKAPRRASWAPTAGWSICPPCWADGSPTGCSAWSAPCCTREVRCVNAVGDPGGCELTATPPESR
jgi:hypothetical protein